MKKLNIGWIKIGDRYIRYHAIESISDTGNFLYTTSGEVFIVPQNQKHKIVRAIGLFKGEKG